MAIRQKNLQEILTLHQQRYPLMEPADYGKLLYQNEFGPEHMISSPDAVQEWLTAEWIQIVCGRADQGTGFSATSQKELSFSGAVHSIAIEDIGNHLYRFHLTDGYDLSIAAPLLSRLFYLTAGQHRGTMEGLNRKLNILRDQEKKPGFPSLEPWLTEYIRSGCPSLHHSETFRQAYAPHYRILRDEYAIYFPVIYQIEKRLLQSASVEKCPLQSALIEKCLPQSDPVEKRPPQSDPVVIAIDGPCGSGKSSLAALLAGLFPSRVLHMDDYYLPLQQRLPGWEQTPCGNMDLERFLQEALLPAAKGEAITCRPYICQQGQLLEPRILPAAPLTIVEGSYSHHPLLAPHYDLKLFLHCHRQEQLTRLKRREGARLDTFLQRWIPLEEAYYRAFDIVSRCDMDFDNTI